MAIVLTSVSPAEVASSGGYRIEITGTGFPLKTPLNAHLGLSADTSDPICLSGVAGQGSNLYAVSPTLLVAYTPRLPGGDLVLLVRNLDTLEEAALVNAITVRKYVYAMDVFRYRALLPLLWRTGPRSLGRVS